MNDVYTIQVLAESCCTSQGADIAIKWRDKKIEYTRLITQSDPHNKSGSASKDQSHGAYTRHPDKWQRGRACFSG